MYILLGITALLVLIAVFYFLSKKKVNEGNSENDAERFARLLVSEIKLYNESKVQQGLINNNLSDSLRDEIGEAGKTYQSRFPDAVYKSYFEDALVEILANGDQSKLDSGIKSSLR